MKLTRRMPMVPAKDDVGRSLAGPLMGTAVALTMGAWSVFGVGGVGGALGSRASAPGTPAAPPVGPPNAPTVNVNVFAPTGDSVGLTSVAFVGSGGDTHDSIIFEVDTVDGDWSSLNHQDTLGPILTDTVIGLDSAGIYKVRSKHKGTTGGWGAYGDSSVFNSAPSSDCGSWDTITTAFTIVTCLNAVTSSDTLDINDVGDPFTQNGLFSMGAEINACTSPDGYFMLVPGANIDPAWPGIPNVKVMRIRRTDPSGPCGGIGQDTTDSVIQEDSSYVFVMHYADSTPADNLSGHGFSMPIFPGNFNGGANGFQVTLARDANHAAAGELTFGVEAPSSINGAPFVADSSCFGTWNWSAEVGCNMLSTGTWYEVQLCIQHISATAFLPHLRVYSFPGGTLIVDNDNLLETDFPSTTTLAAAIAAGDSVNWGTNQATGRRQWYIGLEGGQHPTAGGGPLSLGDYAQYVGPFAMRSSGVDCTSASRWFPQLTS